MLEFPKIMLILLLISLPLIILNACEVTAKDKANISIVRTYDKGSDAKSTLPGMLVPKSSAEEVETDEEDEVEEEEVDDEEFVEEEDDEEAEVVEEMTDESDYEDADILEEELPTEILQEPGMELWGEEEDESKGKKGP
jgi:hypothetical protein